VANRGESRSLVVGQRKGTGATEETKPQVRCGLTCGYGGGQGGVEPPTFRFSFRVSR
jgi:hypothetical protein